MQEERRLLVDWAICWVDNIIRRRSISWLWSIVHRNLIILHICLDTHRSGGHQGRFWHSLLENLILVFDIFDTFRVSLACIAGKVLTCGAYFDLNLLMLLLVRKFQSSLLIRWITFIGFDFLSRRKFLSRLRKWATCLSKLLSTCEGILKNLVPSHLLLSDLFLKEHLRLLAIYLHGIPHVRTTCHPLVKELSTPTFL